MVYDQVDEILLLVLTCKCVNPMKFATRIESKRIYFLIGQYLTSLECHVFQLN